MATHSGKLGAVYVGSNAVAEIRDWSLEITGETTEDTVMGDSWRSHKPTLNSWTSSFSAFWDETDTNGQQTLTAGAEITLNLYPEGNSTSNTYWTGAAIVTSVTKNASYDGMVEASFSVTGNGALTEGTVA